MDSKVEKQFDYKGYKCVVLGLSMGHRCGYVGLTKEHPAFNIEYDELDMDVHGGLTYSSNSIPHYSMDDAWWLGFDCAHGGDGRDLELIKELNNDLQLIKILTSHNYGTVRTTDYVINQLKQLVDQLDSMKPTIGVKDINVNDYTFGYSGHCDISELIGKTVLSIINKDNDELYFICSDSSVYLMHHDQNCCESVTLEDINGSLDNLTDAPIVMAECVSNSEDKALYDYEESYTWTYYKLATIKGYVTLRWYGSSNGYYSEEVDFVKGKRCK